MTQSVRMAWLTLLVLLTAQWAYSASVDVPADSASVRQHADRAFERLDQTLNTSPALQAVKDSVAGTRAASFPPDQYLIGKGLGELSKGRLTCQRVAELAARSDLAKQIRVLIKEHAIDRTRERSGHQTEQDVQVTREEIVQEYLQGVKIVNRQVDETGGMCSATAVMPRTTPSPAPVRETPSLNNESSPASPKGPSSSFPAP